MKFQNRRGKLLKFIQNFEILIFFCLYRITLAMEDVNKGMPIFRAAMKYQLSRATQEKILVISEKLKSKDNKTTRQSITNAMLQKEKAERAIEKLREEQIDIQYSH
jgi:hypothetical protein